MHVEFKLNNIDKPIERKTINKMIASLISKFSDANGRNFVLLTRLSKFLSIMSFIIHPAERKANAPIKKIALCQISVKKLHIN